MTSGLFSVEGMLWLAPGDSASEFEQNFDQKVPLGFRVTCDDFFIDTYPSGMIKEYRSVLSLTDAEGAVASHAVRVNHPITQNGYRIYQASYQVVGAGAATLEISLPSGEQTNFKLGLPGEFTFEDKTGETWVFKSLAFEPDYFRGEDGSAGSRSPNLNNPAVKVAVIRGVSEPVSQWLFLKYPDFHGGMRSDWRMSFKDIDVVYATGLQVAKDPGSSLVWIGSVVLILGLVITLVIIPHSIRIWISSSVNQTQFVFQGTAAARNMEWHTIFAPLRPGDDA